MSSHSILAGSCLTKRIYLRFSQKSWALPINFLLAKLTLVAYEKLLRSKNCSISLSHLTKIYGLSSLRPSKSGTSKSNKKFQLEHGLLNLLMGVAGLTLLKVQTLIHGSCRKGMGWVLGLQRVNKLFILFYFYV